MTKKSLKVFLTVGIIVIAVIIYIAFFIDWPSTDSYADSINSTEGVKNEKEILKNTLQNKISISQCFPPDIKPDDVVSASISGYENGKPVGLSKITVEQKLAELKASCRDSILVDGSGEKIYFYRLTNCWGNPPSDYQEILQTQSDEINRLNEQFTVIEMTCNPSGIPIP